MHTSQNKKNDQSLNQNSGFHAQKKSHFTSINLLIKIIETAVNYYGRCDYFFVKRKIGIEHKSIKSIIFIEICLFMDNIFS